MSEQSSKNSKPKPIQWSKYLKEFLMLFLAISLGFWVENQRQDGEDRRVEKEYMMSLLDELAEDSLKLVDAIRNNQIKMGGFDSLLTALEQPLPYTDSTLHLVYYLQRRYAGSNQSVTLSERTLKQLVATGGYRLIQNRQIVSEIAHYQERIDRLNSQSHTMIYDFQVRARVISVGLFHARHYHGLTRESARRLLDPSLPLKPLDGSPKEINAYANWLNTTNGAFFYYGVQMEELLHRLAQLMAHIENEYQILHPNARPDRLNSKI